MDSLPKYYKNIRFYVGDKIKYGHLEPSNNIKKPYFVSEKDNITFSKDSVLYWEYY